MTKKQRAALEAELEKINAMLAAKAPKAPRKRNALKLVTKNCPKYSGYKLIVNTMDLINNPEFRKAFVESKTKVTIGKSKARWDGELRQYRVREDVLRKAGF